jgi:4-aminobutyrate aminotransferase-like enzyme
MHEIERARLQARVSRVGTHYLDAAKAELRDEFRCHGDVRRVGVEPDGPPALRHPFA